MTIKLKKKVRAGGIHVNHAQPALPVRTRVQAGSLTVNHSQTAR